MTQDMFPARIMFGFCERFRQRFFPLADNAKQESLVWEPVISLSG